MKKKSLLQAFVIALTLVFVGATGALAASVEPELRDPWKSGDEAFECVDTLGYDFGYKVDDWDQENGMDGV